MIYMAFYSEQTEKISALRDAVAKFCDNINCSHIMFEYQMDLLDYLNTSRPSSCVIYFETNSLADGLEIASKVQEINPSYRFNLLCNNTGDTEELFYNGISYFIKTPYEEESIIRSVENVRIHMNEQRGKVITLRAKKGTDAIKLSDISYIMSDKRKVIITLEDREASYYYKLDELEEMLSKGFLRCHQSYIVNMNKIKQFVEEGLILINETFIPVSRKKYYAAKREYLSYVTGGRIG